jgi:hypothetical protein
MRYDVLEFILKNFEYRSGFVYRTACHGGEPIGKRAGWLTVCNGKPYWKISIKRKTMYLHHIIFMMHYKYLPKYIDHVDGNSTNNHIGNLRAATQSQNIANSKLKTNNTSGYKGVSFRRDTGKWQSSVMVNGNHISLGSYVTKEEAHQAYILGSKKYFGEFARAEGKATL